MRLSLFVAGWVFLAVGWSFDALAESDLYAAQTIVTGTDMRSRPGGFALCLRDVLVKVSGNPRLMDDPRVARLADQADQLVAAYSYRDRLSGIPRHDEQGTRDRPYDLSVRFDPAKIDRTLAALGERPWTVDRPRILPVVRVTDARGRSYVLRAAGDDGRDQRGALAAAAIKYGLSYALPGAEVPAPDKPKREAGVPLQGTLVWTEKSGGWVGSWRLVWHDRRYVWHARGVSFDEAFRTMMRGCLQILSKHGWPISAKAIGATDRTRLSPVGLWAIGKKSITFAQLT